MKKFFAWLLVCLMIVTSIPMAAFAAGNGLQITECPGADKVADHNLASAPNHKYITTVAPTCSSFGYDLYLCLDCEAAGHEDVFFAANFTTTSHDWKEIEAAVPATCTETGLAAKFECTICQATKGGDVTPALGHDMVEVPGSATGTCTYGGYVEKECSRCDHEETVTNGGTGHKWEYVKTLVEPGNATNCDVDGVALVECSVCHTQKQVAIDAETDNRKHQLQLVPQVAPTCTAYGYHQYYQCKNCAMSFYDAEGKNPRVTYAIITMDPLYIAPLGHTGTVKEAPTCTDDGVLHCTRCKLDVVILATGHGMAYDATTNTITEGVKGVDWTDAYIAPTCTAQGSYNKRCEHCGVVYEDEVYPAKGHAHYTDATRVDPDSVKYTYYCDKAGKVEWTCDCGKAMSETVNATGHKIETATTNGDCKYTNKQEYQYCTNEWCTLESKTIVDYVTKNDETGVETNVEIVIKHYVPDSLKDLGVKGDHVLKNAVVNYPTCDVDGTKAGACQLCGYWVVTVTDKEPNDLLALGHKYDDPDVDNDIYVIEDANGHLYTAVCDREGCGHKEPTVYEKHSLVADEPYGPYCNEIGYTRYTCDKCGYYEDGNYQNFNFGQPNQELIEDYPQLINLANMDWNLYKNRDAAVNAGHRNLAKTASVCLRHAAYVNGAIVTGLHIYACSDCNRNVLVVDEPPVDACSYNCEGCNQTISYAHDMVKVYFKAPTCEAAGNISYDVCARCGYIDPAIKDSIVIPQLQHNNTTLVDYNHDALIEGVQYNTYDYYDCIWCEGQYKDHPQGEIKNYDNHLYFEIAESDKPACEVGYIEHVCTGCDARECPITKQDKVNHINKNNEILTTGCDNAHITDRHCIICDKNILPDHDWQTAQHYNATCMSEDYDLQVCTICDASRNWNVGEIDPDAHVESDWFVYVDPTYLTTGIEATKCLLDGTHTGTGKTHDGKDMPAGLLQTRELACKNFIFSMDAYNSNSGDIVDSAIVAVDIYMNGDATIADSAAWGAKLTVNYDASNLVYVGIAFPHAELSVSAYNPDVEGLVTLAVSTPDDGSGVLTNATIGADEKIATLYFIADAGVEAPYIDAVKTSLSLSDIEVLNADKKAIGTEIKGTEEVVIENFADIDNDGVITLKDSQLVAELLIKGGYDASADIDKDGAVTFYDFELVYNYVVGNNTYTDLTETY